MEEYRDALMIMDDQVRRLTRVVTDMFMLARADTEKRRLLRGEFRLDLLVEECARAAEILGSRKGVRLIVNRLNKTPYSGDEGLLRQLVLNLLDNAIKHTPAMGQVVVSLETHDSQHEIVVSDTGSGIPREAQPHIFERFYRADKARSRSHSSEFGSGAGLGLSIAQWIASQHGGQVKLVKSDDHGSVFAASLPAN
jgi:signal transduction histidine kinase